MASSRPDGPESEVVARDVTYPSPAIAWYAMATFFVAQIVATIDRGILSFVVEPLRHDLGTSDVQIGLLQGLAFAIFYATVGLPLGIIADIVSRRRLLIAGIVLWSMATLASGFASSFGQMFACRLFVGLGEATLGPCAISMMADLFPASRRARPMSVYLLGGTISGGLSIMLTGAIMGLSPATLHALPVLGGIAPWRFAFILCGLLGFINAAMLLMMPEVGRSGVLLAGRKGFGVAAVSRYFADQWRIFLPFYLALGCYSTATSSLNAWGVTFLVRRFGLSLPSIGQNLGTMNMAFAIVGSLATSVVLAAMIRRGGIREKLRVAWILPLLALPCAFLGLSPTPWVGIVLAAVPMLILPLYGATLLGTVSEMVPGNMRGIAVALYAFAGTMLGGTMGPLLVALATEHLFGDPQSVGYAILLVALPAVLASSLLLFLCQRNVRRLADHDSHFHRVMAANERH